MDSEPRSLRIGCSLDTQMTFHLQEVEADQGQDVKADSFRKYFL